MEFTVSVRSSFEASHEVAGSAWIHCGKPHGHTWRVTVSLMQLTLNREGDVTTAESLQEALDQHLDPYRHRNLNDKFVGGAPTPGNLAVNIMEQLSLRFPRISSVAVKMGKDVEVTVWRELRP